jgi:uncharacterized peroxidase-related enzyme
MSFLAEAAPTPEADALYAEDLAEPGFVMNTTRMWAHQPGIVQELFELINGAAEIAGLSQREKGILVLACASTRGDSYCSLAWGVKLTEIAGVGITAAVLRGEDTGLTPGERALAGWARAVAADPNATAAADLQALRDAGYGDPQVLAITAFVALRQAFSTVNDALGARPDAEFRTLAAAPIRDAVTYGRPIA